MRSAYDEAEIFTSLSSIFKYQRPKTGGASATLAAPAVIDDEDLTFLKTGFSTGDHVLVGSSLQQMIYKLGTIPSGSEAIPITRPVDLAHDNGAPVLEMVELNLGYIEEASASLGGSSSVPSVGAANSNGKIWRGRPDVGDLTISWAQRASSPENLLSAYGINENNVRGDGSPGDPWRALVHPREMGTQRDYAYGLVGLLQDGRIGTLWILNPVPNVSINTSLGAKNQPGVWTVGCTYSHKLYVVE